LGPEFIEPRIVFGKSLQLLAVPRPFVNIRLFVPVRAKPSVDELQHLIEQYLWNVRLESAFSVSESD